MKPYILELSQNNNIIIVDFTSKDEAEVIKRKLSCNCKLYLSESIINNIQDTLTDILYAETLTKSEIEDVKRFLKNNCNCDDMFIEHIENDYLNKKLDHTKV